MQVGAALGHTISFYNVLTYFYNTTGDILSHGCYVLHASILEPTHPADAEVLEFMYTRGWRDPRSDWANYKVTTSDRDGPVWSTTGPMYK